MSTKDAEVVEYIIEVDEEFDYEGYDEYHKEQEQRYRDYCTLATCAEGTTLEYKDPFDYMLAVVDYVTQSLPAMVRVHGRWQDADEWFTYFYFTNNHRLTQAIEDLDIPF